jgi:hypothetical protein
MKLDTYTLCARLFPALLVVLPVPIALAAWVPVEHLPQFPLWCAPLTAAATFLLAQLGRDAGKRAEPGLWRSWGGPPTTRRLRHRSRDMNPIVRARQHERLAQAAGVAFPSADDEMENPAHADSIYEAAVHHLRQNTRNDPLIFKENVGYGFRRNLWAMKAVGVTLSLCGALAAILAYAVHGDAGGALQLTAAGTAVANACLLAWWLLRIGPEWVRLAGEAYAERLLASCDSLPPTGSTA